ncbi:hypothetical protein ECDEC12A_3814 [Escherichia coli DEC12A]|uniref:Uncharacterized protein n=1 Tax=Escherichia coli 4.0967 TaxID=869687 RepID=A0AAN3V8S0_ECOLX|nr:hypothetical protein EAKF1_ch3000c [Escherichia albertii KF1]AXI33756.1 hypothetical protein FORC64_0848 [Escherichia coli]EDX30453.1 hypothetical protein EcB171_2436 [Escherichia coli B171]EHW33060.1 hypothetical protein ECDEC9A_4066 [Escherichia coli DEC9A]EHW38229.1 hypothetical protein ECDEC9B_3117 [Escherichia coli DEC9B]EHW49949.1 hypothetical protein ECDEC9D_3701 [Escherichia coli DEC9D]EHW54257.1 hypothetical protein ECDEC9E_4207 [Escherichia coli DEC9E]EHW88909.1 hypothetical pro
MILWRFELSRIMKKTAKLPHIICKDANNVKFVICSKS